MAEVELDAPELEVNEEASRFRRGVAVLVVLITLFGAIVAYAQAVESNAEDVAARDAQRRAIEGLGAQVDASAALVSDLRVASSIDAVLQRQALNAGRVSSFAEGSDLDADVHLAARERLAEVAEVVADLTPIDPADTSTLDADFAQRNRRPDQARLRQTVEADLADQHGSKADTYVAILTVLAVSLFLLGLSLTVEGRRRFVLLGPGIAIALVCVAWTAATFARKVDRVSEPAIVDVAEGQALQDAGDFEGAIERYDEAIEDSPGFAAAYARRASARFLQGSSQLGQTGFVSLTSDEALEAALDDLDEALELGGRGDVNTVADAGFFRFLAGDFEESVELSSEAIELNQLIAPLWFNLGVAHVGLGDEDAAEDAYEEGIDVLFENEPSAGTRAQVLAGARTDLSILRTLLDGDELEDVLDLVEDMEVRLAEVELEGSTCAGGEPCELDVDAGDAELGEVEFIREGAFVTAFVDVEGLDDGDAVGVAWYFRTDGDDPFAQASLSFQAAEVTDGSFATNTIALFTPACPVVGDYLLRVYAGAEFVGEAAASIGDEIVPLDPDEEGPPAVEPAFGVGTPLGSEFEALVDPVEGIETCVPAGFEVAELDLSEADAFINYTSAEHGLAVALNVVPGVLEDLDIDVDLAEQELVADFVPGAEVVPMSVAARTIDGESITLDGFGGVGEDQQGDLSAIFVVLGPDNANRTILISSFAEFEGDLEAVLTEVVNTVTFTGVDAAAP